MKCSLDLSSFLEEISSLSHPLMLLCFFALLTLEGFLISPCCCLELCIQLGLYFPFPLFFASLLFSGICKISSDNQFAFLHFFFFGMVLVTASYIMLRTSVHTSLGTLSTRSDPFNLSPLLYNHNEFDLGFTGMA